MEGLTETRRFAGFFVFARETLERLAVELFERHTLPEMTRLP